MSEKQYDQHFITHEEHRYELGPSTGYMWHTDPKHLLFYLARYKFVAKMLARKQTAIEIGCGDAFGSRLITANGTRYCGTDFDRRYVEAAIARCATENSTFVQCDWVREHAPFRAEAIFALDVIEHIKLEDMNNFMHHMLASFEHKGGICILGTPSFESQTYASPLSREGHVNCRSGDHWRTYLLKHFHNVHAFGMNDEVVHTGFLPMSHYLFFVCTEPKL